MKKEEMRRKIENYEGRLFCEKMADFWDWKLISEMEEELKRMKEELKKMEEEGE